MKKKSSILEFGKSVIDAVVTCLFIFSLGIIWLWLMSGVMVSGQFDTMERRTWCIIGGLVFWVLLDRLEFRGFSTRKMLSENAIAYAIIVGAFLLGFFFA